MELSPACEAARDALRALREAASHPMTGRLHSGLDMEALVRLSGQFLRALPNALEDVAIKKCQDLSAEARLTVQWCESERIRDGSIRRKQLPMLPGVSLGSIVWQLGAACRLLANAGNPEAKEGGMDEDLLRAWRGVPWRVLPELRCLCLCPVNRPPRELTMAEIVACWRVVSEPLYARPRVVTLLAAIQLRDAEDADGRCPAAKQLLGYLRALELRACELALGLQCADGGDVARECYDHIKYSEGPDNALPNKRCVSVLSGFSTLLRQHSLVCASLGCGDAVAPRLDDSRHTLLNGEAKRCAGRWCRSAAIDWRSKAACDQLQLRCRRALLTETDYGEAHARAGDVTESDRLQLVRVARQETSGALLGMDISPHIGASPRLRKMSQMFWTDAAFRGLVTRGACGLFGTFLLPSDCLYAGRSPLHAYPCLLDTEEEHSVLLCHPSGVTERVLDFTEALARWNYEMCTEHRGQVVLAGITFSLLDFGQLLFPGIVHMLSPPEMR